MTEKETCWNISCVEVLMLEMKELKNLFQLNYDIILFSPMMIIHLKHPTLRSYHSRKGTPHSQRIPTVGDHKACHKNKDCTQTWISNYCVSKVSRFTSRHVSITFVYDQICLLENNILFFSIILFCSASLLSYLYFKIASWQCIFLLQCI